MDGSPVARVTLILPLGTVSNIYPTSADRRPATNGPCGTSTPTCLPELRDNLSGVCHFWGILSSSIWLESLSSGRFTFQGADQTCLRFPPRNACRPLKALPNPGDSTVSAVIHPSEDADGITPQCDYAATRWCSNTRMLDLAKATNSESSRSLSLNMLR